MIFPHAVSDYLVAQGRTREALEEQAARQFEAMAGVLVNADFASILDIGCGLALLDIHIINEFGLTIAHLLDGDGTAPKQSGFQTEMKPWADVHLGAELVRANTEGDHVCVYEWNEPLHKRYDGTIDLIISSRSWCHHYPVSTYAAMVKRCLASDGLLIVDIRNGTDGIQQLRAAGFDIVAQISDQSQKCKRFALRHT